MTGVVRPSREAVVSIRLIGNAGTDLRVEAILDTGFTESLTLPQRTIDALGLLQVNTDAVTLADGSMIAVALYEGIVVWDGQARSFVIHCMEGTPLIGMSLLYDHLLTMEVVDGGPVAVAPMPGGRSHACASAMIRSMLADK